MRKKNKISCVFQPKPITDSEASRVLVRPTTYWSFPIAWQVFLPGRLSTATRVGQGGLTQTNGPPIFPGRFRSSSAAATTSSPNTSPHSLKPRLEVRMRAPRP
jgi:hypothetical protein